MVSKSVNPQKPNMSKAYKTNFDEKRNRFSAIWDTSVKAGKGEDLRQKKPSGIQFNKVYKKGRD